MAQDVQCPKCGAKHFIMYGDQYRCPCGHTGKVGDDKRDKALSELAKADSKLI